MFIKKDGQLNWDPQQHRDFEDSKSALCVAPLLIYANMSLPHVVVIDAFGGIARGILMQDQGEDL